MNQNKENKMICEAKERDFEFWMPLEVQKSKEGEMRIRGVASDENGQDLQGEKVFVDGLEIDYLLQRGAFNWNHGKTAGDILGEIDKAEKRNGKLYVEGFLYPHVEEAVNVYNLMRSMRETGSKRRLGLSIEGKIKERIGNEVRKAWLKNIAVTYNPINGGTWVDMIKSFGDFTFTKCTNNCEGCGAGGCVEKGEEKTELANDKPLEPIVIEKGMSKIPGDLDKLTGKELDNAIIRTGEIAELDAVNLYEQMAALTTNKRLKKVILDISKEEKTHIAEFQTLLLENDVEQMKEMEVGKKEVEDLTEKAATGQQEISQTIVNVANSESIYNNYMNGKPIGEPRKEDEETSKKIEAKKALAAGHDVPAASGGVSGSAIREEDLDEEAKVTTYDERHLGLKKFTKKDIKEMLKAEGYEDSLAEHFSDLIFKAAEVKGFWRTRRGKREYVSPFTRHQLEIAKKTIKMPEAIVGVMGGMTKEEAKKILEQHKEGLEGFIKKERPFWKQEKPTFYKESGWKASLRQPTEKEWAHEKMRISTMSEKALATRVNKIVDPQKLYNFSVVLKDEDLHDLAQLARNRLNEMMKESIVVPSLTKKGPHLTDIEKEFKKRFQKDVIKEEVYLEKLSDEPSSQWSLKYFKTKAAANRGYQVGFMGMEDEDLTTEGLIRKLEEWDETEHGVPEIDYNRMKKQIEAAGKKVPSEIRIIPEETSGRMIEVDRELSRKINTYGEKVASGEVARRMIEMGEKAFVISDLNKGRVKAHTKLRRGKVVHVREYGRMDRGDITFKELMEQSVKKYMTAMKERPIGEAKPRFSEWMKEHDMEAFSKLKGMVGVPTQGRIETKKISKEPKIVSALGETSKEEQQKSYTKLFKILSRR